MHHRPKWPTMSPVRPTVVLTLALASALAPLLGGCAEMHRGAEAVGRVGGAAGTPVASVADDDGAAAPRGGYPPGVKTVRPRGAPRAPAVDAGAAEPVAPPAAMASAVPSPHQIFDFHPAGSRPDSWRQPFVIDTNDGPLAADVRRSAAELKAFLADQKAGKGRGDAVAGVDGARTGTARKLCGEMDVASGKPGCAVPRPAAAAAQ